jgi:hypothetical protein
MFVFFFTPLRLRERNYFYLFERPRPIVAGQVIDEVS